MAEEEVVERAVNTVERLATIEQPFTGRAARVFNSANLSITTGVQTALTFDSELYDTDAMHSTSVNTGRLTCVTPGLYMIGAAVRWDTNATGYRHIQIRLNGGSIIGSAIIPAATGIPTGQVINVPYVLAVGDYVECTVVQTSGGNLNVLAVSRLSPDLWMTLQV
jgi:hypothetical protein